jgi:hypothetical protein
MPRTSQLVVVLVLQFVDDMVNLVLYRNYPLDIVRKLHFGVRFFCKLSTYIATLTTMPAPQSLRRNFMKNWFAVEVGYTSGSVQTVLCADLFWLGRSDVSSLIFVNE